MHSFFKFPRWQLLRNYDANILYIALYLYHSTGTKHLNTLTQIYYHNRYSSTLYLVIYCLWWSSLLCGPFLQLQQVGSILQLWCASFLSLFLLRSVDSRHASFSNCSSRALEHRLRSDGAWAQLLPACEIFTDQGLNLHLLLWLVDLLSLIS